MSQDLLLKWFNALSKESVIIAGGKGASLGEMTRAGIPVPNGFVILSASFEKFLGCTDLNVEIDSILEKVNHKEISSIENASEEIKSLIMNANMPIDIEKEIVKNFKILNSPFVAVRSSATSEDSSSAAWAGQLDSFLNTKKDTLLENVKKCWASLFTPRAIFYRFEKGLHNTKISVAVVVQKMVNSEISGIAFSVHPVTQDRNQLIIEAGLGLGEAIVSGQITPDSYVIEKNPRRIIDKNISAQERGLFKVETGGSEWKENLPRGKEQKLSDKQIMELSEIILKIEKHYGFPCDIEWAYEAKKFFIVQSRPITTLTDKTNDKEMSSTIKENKKEKATVKKNEILKENKIDNNSFEWAKNCLQNNSFDVKEARISVPMAEIMFSAFGSENILGDTYSPVFFPYKGEKGMQIIQMENYKSLERQVWEKAIQNRKKFIKILSGEAKIQKQIDRIFLTPQKLKKAKKEEILIYYNNLTNLMKKWWKYGSIGEDKGLVVEEKIIPLLMKNHDIDEAEALEYASDMTLPLELSVFSKERIAFLDLCIKAKINPKLIEKKDKKYFAKVLNYSKKYFYARTSFYETINLGYENLIKIIKETNSKTTLDSLKEEMEKISNSINHLKEKQKAHKKKLTPTKEEENYLWYFKLMHIWMDERKVNMIKQASYFFNLLQEITNRKKITYNNISLLTLEELRNLLSGKEFNFTEVEKRKDGLFFIYKGNETLRFYKKEALELMDVIPNETDSKDSLRGAIACKGNGEKVRGKVRIVHNPSKDVFNEGEILVTTMTRPEFVPIMKSALAIITDEGGLTSHAAIVSRELGVVCIIGTKIATKILHDGDLVEVDANKGLVRVISSSKV